MSPNTHPYDEVDLAFMVATAMFPNLFIVAVIQYLARRSDSLRSLTSRISAEGVRKALPLPLPTPSRALLPPKTENVLVLRKDLFTILEDAYHLLVIGHTGGGKTTLVHEFARRIADAGNRVLVGDPDAAPGQWPGCEVYGAGDDFQGIEKMLEEVKGVISQRRHLRAEKGQRKFPLLYIVVDEIADVMAECPTMRPLFEALVRRGRKIGIRFVAGVQDKLVKTLKLEGQSELRKNMVTIELRLKNERRTATINEYEDGNLYTVAVPDLSSPEDFIVGGDVEWDDDDDLLRSLLSIGGETRCTPEQFIRECCTQQDGGKITAGQLYEAYKQWCTTEPVSATAFGLSLGRAGLSKTRTSKGYIEYQNLGVVNVYNQSVLANVR